MINKNFSLIYFFIPLTKYLFMTEKIKLSLCEKIDRARDGRSQKSIVKKMIQVGLEMDEVRFSTKKKANSFSEEEVKALSKILNTDLS